MRFANVYGSCQIDDLPGCSQIAVSHSVFILPQYRSQHHGSDNYVLRQRRIREMLYDCAICTVVSTNIREQKILINNGWKKVHSFSSRKTENSVDIWVKDIT